MSGVSFPFDFKIIPVVVINNECETVSVISALSKGGIKVAEITFRTECAASAIEIASREFDDMTVGAGTVINGEQCEKAINAGAKFIVSPGYSSEVHKVCIMNNIPYLPGATTATEIMNLIANDINVIKFFPSESCGGVKAIKAFSSAFPGVTFIPTGGINAENMLSYLSVSSVKAVGGSWMLKGTADEITALSAKAMEAIK